MWFPLLFNFTSMGHYYTQASNVLYILLRKLCGLGVNVGKYTVPLSVREVQAFSKKSE